MQGQVETLDTYIPGGINHNTHGNVVLSFHGNSVYGIAVLSGKKMSYK